MPNCDGWKNPRDIEDIWRVSTQSQLSMPEILLTLSQDHFDYFYENEDEFIFPMTIHPDVSGRPHVLLMHQRYISQSTIKAMISYKLVQTH